MSNCGSEGFRTTWMVKAVTGPGAVTSIEMRANKYGTALYAIGNFFNDITFGQDPLLTAKQDSGQEHRKIFILMLRDMT